MHPFGGVSASSRSTDTERDGSARHPPPGSTEVESEVSAVVTLLRETAPAGLRLVPNAVAVPALSSAIRPALVLPERSARALLSAARDLDVGNGGRFAAGPAGVQVWSGPFDGPGGARGNASHLGSVDWTYDTPAKHWAMIYRAMVTDGGLARGESTASILQLVLGLAGLTVEGERVQLAQPPARDPFHRTAARLDASADS